MDYKYIQVSNLHLQEYVIVLLRNGRRKQEAKNELNVFLGDDSDSFISWLWDHLASHLELYVQPQESYPDEVANINPISVEHGGRNDSQELDSESEREKYSKESRSRRNREWKGLVRDVAESPPLRSSEIHSSHFEEKTLRKLDHAKRSLSPRHPVHRKRSRQDEPRQTKREVFSHPTIDAPRRLLQFAVRDAVGTSRPLSSRMEPALKRLHSVVSTSIGDSSVDARPQRIRSVARVPNAMTTAFKAAAEAAEDVIKVRCSGNVFDRLGRGVDVSGISQSSELREPTMEDGEYEDFDQMLGPIRSNYPHRSEYGGQYAENMKMSDRGTGLASDSASDNDGYDVVNVMGRRTMDASQTATSGGNKDDDSLTVQYSMAKNSDEIVQKTRARDQDPPALVANTSRKIVNISVNVNTWKPSHYQVPMEVSEVNSRKSVQESEAAAGKPGVRLMKESNNPFVVGNGIDLPAADIESQKTLQSTPGSYSTGRPLDDADSRTIFVNNVHFAATKDSLSRHFNKFGEVLKVVIVTDAATGQPKGSAYVEFMRKEAAELALSLNGTSFMSRILKVVKRGSAHQEVAPIMAWPRMARGSPFAARLSRFPFPRGMGTFRSRLPIKPGARSLQWKRDAPATLTGEGTMSVQNGGLSSSNNIPSPTARSLTYVRTEPKTDGTSGSA
ncbi:hypothetical protein HHK36_011949 [Tetracentron sinense]|uniref:RRM domain-containing protein n=1 Tax=Tetracentron sinense TaxID=13715 RepID=A0A835DHP5_TETSI|nr:hypothetical protein HHK36_011949 [Tetracentron sinense]